MISCFVVDYICILTSFNEWDWMLKCPDVMLMLFLSCNFYSEQRQHDSQLSFLESFFLTIDKTQMCYDVFCRGVFVSRLT